VARLPALGLLLVALLLAGCTGADPGADDGGSAGRATDEPAPRIDYVALGDSYSAGPLITTVRSDPSECGRSTDNYPAFLADWLDVASYRDVTCSGAETGDLTRRQDVFGVRRVPPQLDALSRGTDLVTVGLGGNDFDIFSTLSGCAGSGQPGPCQVDFTALERDAARVEPRLREALDEVARRAPRAEVLVVGYPRVLPDRDTCPAAGLDEAAAAATRQVQQRLEESIESAAATSGATYVDLWGASRGHDVCAGREAWVNGRRLRVGEAAPFHPFLAGMRAAARVVYEQVTGEEAPTEDGSGSYAAPDPAAVRYNRVTR
jgi:lysophospholipase L1-like esterase